MRFFRKPAGRAAAKAPSSARPLLEELEARLAPYAATGNAWPEPQLVTISFVPDGTLMTSGPSGNVYSDLFAKFNARWSTQAWQSAILSAAQTWAQYANVNFAVVSDNGTTSGQGAYQQGDPGMGDIRIGGYNIGSSYLGMTYLPPPANNYSAAGDLTFNDTQAFNIGRTYDLQTVALHEFGHALGLDHSTTGTANAMYPTYNGVKSKLSADDLAGIQAIYGARAPDASNQGTSNGSFATATDLTSQITSSSSGNLVGGLLSTTTSLLTGTTNQSVQVTANDLTTVGATEYYTFVVPSNAPSNFTVYVQSSGLSLLRPQVTVYASDQVTVLGSASGAGSYNGANLSVAVSNAVPGQRYYVAVTGADATAFGTGNYNLVVNFGNQSAPTPASPVTPLVNGAVLQAGGGLALTAPDSTEPDFLTVDPSFADGDSGPSPVALLAQSHPADQAGSTFVQFVHTEEQALHTVLRGAEFGQLKALAEKALADQGGHDQAAVQALDQLMSEVVNVLEEAHGQHNGPGASSEATGD